MKKKIARYAFLVLALLQGGSVAGQAADLVVGPDESISSLKQALELARPGDTILLKSGVYQEGTVLVDKSVQIIGQGFPVLDGEDEYQIMTVTADNVVIRGIEFRNVGVSFVEDNAAIKLEGVSGARIVENRFIEAFFGVYLAQSQKTLIEGNEFYGTGTREATTGNGIHLWYCKEITIRNNKINGHRDGIYFEFVEDSKVERNLSWGNLRYGLHFMFSDRCEYLKNVFRQNGAGVAVMYTHNMSMHDNLFEKNWGSAAFGLLLKEITDSYITNNRFYKNSIGLYTEGSNRLHVRENTFEENGWAVKIMANSMESEFVRNNFINNTFDVATNSRQNFNTFDSNYWSSYTGYDLNRDGIGDVPFRPVRLFSYIVEKQQTAMILSRSFFIDILDIAERIVPMLTPETLVDAHPRIKKLNVPTGDKENEG